MTLIDSVIHGYVLQMTQVYIFFVVQFSSESAELYSDLLNFIEVYWTYWSFMKHVGFYWMIIELKWRSVCNGFKITFVSEKHMVEDDILFTNHLVGK